ncbi:MAG: helix-turn-helix transcriptional regulator [Cyanobium sp.]
MALSNSVPAVFADVSPGLENLPHKEMDDSADILIALRGDSTVRSCRHLVPEAFCVNRVGQLKIGQSLLISEAGTPAEIVMENTPIFHLLVMVKGSLSLSTPTGELSLGEGDVALLPPGPRKAQTSHYSLATIALRPQALAVAAATMAGTPRNGAKPSDSLEHLPLSVAPGPLAQLIHRMLRTIDAALALGRSVAAHLALDDVLHRTAATLLHPELLWAEPADLLGHRDGSAPRNFDILIDYILANLDQPLTLSDLEARSHYSRRSLQYAFQERLHCSPKQWIREQRLTVAMRKFQCDGQRPSVQEVAQACGYANLSHFSRDFKARFGINPSVAKRL